MNLSLDRRHGGVAQLLGYLLLVVVLFSDPARGSTALASVGTTVAFVVGPVLGIVSGVYAVVKKPYAGVGLFVMGSYLAFVGLTLGFGLVPADVGVTVAGFVLFALALVAVLAGTFAMGAFLSSP